MATSTSSRLAPELWSSIFSFYLGSPKANDYDRNLLLLSSICGHWRDISLSTPIFWSHITYAPPSPYDTDRFTKHSDRIRTRLSRSGSQCPLSVSLNMGSSRSVAGGDQVLREIISQSQRWQSLTLKADSIRTVLKSITPSLLPGFPQLERAEIDVPFCGDDDDTRAFISLFFKAPLLSGFHIQSIDGTVLSLLTRLPLSQLRSVSLDTVYSAEDVFRVLGHLGNVEKLKLSLDVGSSSRSTVTSPPIPSIVHPTLRHLSIDVSVRGDPLIISHLQRQVSTVLDNVFFPSLQSFSVSSAEIHSSLTHLSSFFERHRTLRTLTLVEKCTEARKAGGCRLGGQAGVVQLERSLVTLQAETA